MIFRTSLFRLTNLAYKTASKKKLNYFINFIIFISIFAITASGLSMYYENKIDELDRKIVLFESQKIILENQISVVPIAVGLIDALKDSNLSKKSNLEILSEINVQDEEVKFVSLRQKYFRQYYNVITLIYVSTSEISYLIQNVKLIFENDKEVLSKVKMYKKINENHINLIEKISNQAMEIEDGWLKFEAENSISKYGLIGIDFIAKTEGAEVTHIGKDSPAEKSNLKIGDIILSVNDISLANLTFEEIFTKVKYPPNVKVKFEIKNRGQVQIIPEQKYNKEIYQLKDSEYYIKFQKFRDEAINILDQQRSIYLDFGLDLTNENLDKINNQTKKVNEELKLLSSKEANIILFAFIIQLLIFLSSQYFEFSIGQQNEKKHTKKQ